MTPKTVKLSSLRADLAKEREGDWIEAPHIGVGVAFLVRSINFPDFQTARDRALMKLAERFGAEAVPSEENARVMGSLAAEHLLLGWRGFDVDYSPDTAIEVLTDEGYRRVRLSIFAAATRVGARETEFLEDAAKNSAAPSAEHSNEATATSG